MIAHRYQRLFSCASDRAVKRSMLIATFFLCVLVSACQTKRPATQEVVGRSAVTVAPKALQGLESPSTQRASIPTSPVEQALPALPPKPPTLAEQVALRLRTAFAINLEHSNALRVEGSPRSADSPSLFEEAIILGKLRAILKSSAAVGSSASVSFQGGTATVFLPASTNSGTASVLIAKMLSLEGVNELRVDFGK